MLWPLEPAVHARDVEQRLMNLETLAFRMEGGLIGFGIGGWPISPTVDVPGTGTGVDPCFGEDPTTYFNTSRVFAFTLPALTGPGLQSFTNCNNLTGSWSLPYVGSGTWQQIKSVGSPLRNYQARLTVSGFYVTLDFAAGSPGTSAVYRVLKCAHGIPPGDTVFDFVSSTTCTGWPSTITVTCT